MRGKRADDFGAPEQERTERTRQKSNIRRVGRGVRVRHVNTSHVATVRGRGGTEKRSETIVREHAEPVAGAEEFGQTIGYQRHASPVHVVPVCR